MIRVGESLPEWKDLVLHARARDVRAQPASPRQGRKSGLSPCPWRTVPIDCMETSSITFLIMRDG
eukprot:9481300-Pyramimonas_sp.AAC.1